MVCFKHSSNVHTNADREEGQERTGRYKQGKEGTGEESRTEH